MTGCIMTRGLCYSVITAVIASFPLVTHIVSKKRECKHVARILHSLFSFFY